MYVVVNYAGDKIHAGGFYNLIALGTWKFVLAQYFYYLAVVHYY